MILVKPSFKILSIMGMYGGASEAQPLKLIELAGRTCYKSGEAITSESAKEFSRLRIKQEHESVIEHSAMTVQFIVDRGVTHEKVRHRLCAFSQECLTGDTKINKKVTIKELFDRKNNSYGKTHNKTISLKSVNKKGQVIPNKISEVWYKGKAPVFEVTTKLGYKIQTTREHKFQIKNGSFTELKNINPGDEIMVNGRPSFCFLSDKTLQKMYIQKKLSPLEISQEKGIPVHSIIRKLKQLKIFVKRLNDKNKEKYNKNHTRESYEKMRETIKKQYEEGGRVVWNKGICGEESHSYNRKVTSSEREKASIAKIGKRNPSWEGGISRGRAYRKKQNILTCEICGSKKRLEVHHIDYNPQNNKKKNLIKVCDSCHKKYHHGSWYTCTNSQIDSVISIEHMGVKDVYDLEMKGPNHNYVANGFIVHNSTRFVNYAKSDEIAVIIPFFFDPLEILKSIKVPNGYFFSGNNKGTWEFSSYEEIMMNSFDVWFLTCLWSQWGYMTLVNEFNRKPEQARTVLPNSTKTEIVVTANFREWKHIFNLRCSKAAHPQMREIMIPLLKECQKQIPVIFDNITYDENFYHEHDNRTV